MTSYFSCLSWDTQFERAVCSPGWLGAGRNSLIISHDFTFEPGRPFSPPALRSPLILRRAPSDGFCEETGSGQFGCSFGEQGQGAAQGHEPMFGNQGEGEWRLGQRWTQKRICYSQECLSLVPSFFIPQGKAGVGSRCCPPSSFWLHEEELRGSPVEPLHLPFVAGRKCHRSTHAFIAFCQSRAFLLLCGDLNCI